MDNKTQKTSLVSANVRFGLLIAAFVGGLYYVIFKL